jgi:hypothetical protein
MIPNLIEPFNLWKQEQSTELGLNDNDLYILFLEEQLGDALDEADWNEKGLYEWRDVAITVMRAVRDIATPEQIKQLPAEARFWIAQGDSVIDAQSPVTMFNRELMAAATEFARLSRMDRPKTLAAWSALENLEKLLKNS